MENNMISIGNILTAALCAAGYSIVYYSKTAADNPEETFDKYKFLATVLVGVMVGLSLEIAGINLAKEQLSTKLAAYSGTIAMLETSLKVVYRSYLRKYLRIIRGGKSNG